jgi:hypothetical protein
MQTLARKIFWDFAGSSPIRSMVEGERRITDTPVPKLDCGTAHAQCLSRIRQRLTCRLSSHHSLLENGARRRVDLQKTKPAGSQRIVRSAGTKRRWIRLSTIPPPLGLRRSSGGDDAWSGTLQHAVVEERPTDQQRTTRVLVGRAPPAAPFLAAPCWGWFAAC